MSLRGKKQITPKAAWSALEKALMRIQHEAFSSCGKKPKINPHQEKEDKRCNLKGRGRRLRIRDSVELYRKKQREVHVQNSTKRTRNSIWPSITRHMRIVNNKNKAKPMKVDKAEIVPQNQNNVKASTDSDLISDERDSPPQPKAKRSKKIDFNAQ